MKLKTLFLTGLVLMLSAGVLFAATPAEIITDLTDLTEEQVYELHAGGSTYGQIAEDKGVLEAYKEAILKEKISLINQRVTEGTFTQEQADAFIEKLTTNQATCDPDNPQRVMLGSGMRFGGGKGNGGGFGNGNGVCDGTGLGLGNGGANGRAGGMGFGRTQSNN